VDTEQRLMPQKFDSLETEAKSLNLELENWQQ
jgi:hypothetical protein